MTDDVLARLRAADPLQGQLPPALQRRPELPRRREERPRLALLVTNLALVALVALHGVDHSVIQDRGMGALTTEVVAGGFAMGAASLASMFATARGWGWAPVLSLFSGPWIAVAAFAAHFLPHWSAFSDPYVGNGFSPLSWVIVSAIIVAGLAVGAAGVLAARTARSPRRAGRLGS
jgi:hypothetical protein